MRGWGRVVMREPMWVYYRRRRSAAVLIISLAALTVLMLWGLSFSPDEMWVLP